MKRFNLLHRAILLVLLAFGGSRFGWAETTLDQQPASEPALAEPTKSTAADTDKPKLTPEIKLMQEIEPGFVPKDDRAVQLFLLQKVVAETEESIKSKGEQAQKVRSLFSQKFRDDLAKFAESKLGGIDERLDRSTEELIKQYELALKNNPDHPRFAADALYFLGLYYFEVDEKDYFQKLRLYSEAKEQGREDVPYPDENFTRTIDTYEKLIEKYPNYRHMDSVYYLLGLALWYEGAFYNAVDRFQALIKEFPDSRFVEELWFRLGEYFYDMDDYDDAIKAYEKVAKNLKSPLYDKAIYKIAWSQFQKDRYMLAVDNFIKVLELTYLEKGEGAASGMRAEVTKYIVKSFSEQLLEDEGKKQGRFKAKASKKDEKEYAEKLGIKLVERISHYFAALGNPPYVRDILIETASQLVDESKFDGAILALEKTIELNLDHQDNPRIAGQIVDILQEAHRLEEARERNQALIKQYGKKSLWYQKQAGNRDAQKFAREAVRDAVLALAVHYHKTGKDLKLAKDELKAAANFKKAASLYAFYLREYPERDDTHKAIFYFAEAAYELNRYRAALDAYQLLKDYPLPMPDTFRRDATFNIVFTFRHVLENEAKLHRFKEIDFDALTSKQRGLEPEPIPPLGLKYLDAIDEFLKIAPHDEQVPVLLFHAAAIYYVYGHSDEAQSRFYYIIDTYPKTTAASVAARLVIDDAVAKEDWQRVVELAKRFQQENLGGQKGDFARIEGNARFKIARAVFEQANELQKNNQLSAAKAKYKEAADLFAALLQEDPKNPFADVMLFNSARAITESGTLTAALPLYRKLYTQYPNSEYAKAARFQEALALEKMLKFADAAKAYDGIIKHDPKSEAAGDAMLNKALLYEAAGELANAATAFSEFAKKYPARVEAPDALLTTASIYKKMGRTSQQIAMLEQFIKQYRKDPSKIPAVIEAHVEIGDTYGELERSAGSAVLQKRYGKARLDNYRSAVALYSPELKSPTAAFFAAKAQLILEKPEQDAFRKLTINARVGKAQADQLTAMMKQLTELSAKNEAIIKAYAQPVWNAESLRRIGALYEHLAKSMVKAPCPRDVANIDEFACDEYTVLLEDKAAVLEEKALSAYKQAYEIAMSAYDAPSDLVDSIQAGLNRLRPGLYQRVGNVIVKPETGAFYGQGRMLSTGKMASQLHPDESDPDRKPPKAEEVLPKVETKEEGGTKEGEPTEGPKEKQEEQTKEAKPGLQENFEEFEEDFE